MGTNGLKGKEKEEWEGEEWKVEGQDLPQIRIKVGLPKEEGLQPSSGQRVLPALSSVVPRTWIRALACLLPHVLLVILHIATPN